MPDLREKCAYINIYDIIWLSFFLFFKSVDFEQNSWFFGPKSRSSVGGFPHKWREFITEIIKENDAFEWIWVKIRFWAENMDFFYDVNACINGAVLFFCL